MFKVAFFAILNSLSVYWNAFTLRLSLGHSAMTAARLAYLEVHV
ncbi:MAG: hypothetical protein AB4041_04555 [Microcystaceae cyanobacterium]